MAEEKIALYFVPANEGDHLIGIPARDLTEAEVAWYAAHEPGLMRDATAPHPGTGKALYQKAAQGGKQAAATPPVVPAEAPAKGAEA